MEMIERFTTGHQTEIIERSDGTKYLEGYGVVFYDGRRETEFLRPDGFIERIKPDAFNSVLSQTTPVALRFNHDRNFSLDDTENTLKLSIDRRGVKYVSPFDADNPQYQIMRSKLKKGKGPSGITGASFKAMVEIEKEGNVKWIVGCAKCEDLSLVDYPAYPATSAVARQAEQAEQDPGMEETNKRRAIIQSL